MKKIDIKKSSFGEFYTCPSLETLLNKTIDLRLLEVGHEIFLRGGEGPYRLREWDHHPHVDYVGNTYDVKAAIHLTIGFNKLYLEGEEERVTLEAGEEVLIADMKARCLYANKNEHIFLFLDKYADGFYTVQKDAVTPEGLTPYNSFSSYSTMYLEPVFDKYNADEFGLSIDNRNVLAAYFDKGFKSIVIPEGCKYISNRVFKDSNIEEITLPKSLKKIEYGAFENCKELHTINGWHDDIEVEVHAFDGCEKLYKDDMLIFGKRFIKYYGNKEELVIPEGIEIINREAINGKYSNADCLPRRVICPTTLKLFSSCFAYNSSIEEIIINSDVILENSAISNCPKLKSFVDNGHKVDIGPFAFNGCSSFGKDNNGFGIVCNQLVAYCGEPEEIDGVLHVYVPEGVKAINEDVFYIDEKKSMIVHLPASMRGASMTERYFGGNCDWKTPKESFLELDGNLFKGSVYNRDW